MGCESCCNESVTLIPGPVGPAGEPGEPGAGGGAEGFFGAYTFAELKAIPSSSTNIFATVSGEDAPFTDQPRIYMWNNTSVEAELKPSIMTPNDSVGPGRWIQII